MGENVRKDEARTIAICLVFNTNFKYTQNTKFEYFFCLSHRITGSSWIDDATTTREKNIKI